MEALGVHFVGMGVSGGEEGALHGPSLMPGGTREAYDALAPILKAVSAKAEGEACVDYMGSDGAGHYVKMVHNGIEYADMQMIADTYFVMKNVLGMTAEEIEKIFNPEYTTKEKGLGLGIPLAMEIIRGHGGDVRVISRKGFGTTFEIILPREKITDKT